MPLTVLIVDDHPLMREGLRAALDTIPEVEVVAEAENGREAVTKTVALRPAVVLLDVDMPELNGFQALEAIVKQAPATKVLMYTMYCNDAYVLRAMRSGAAGYLLKTSKPDELERALEAIRAGEMFLSPPAAAALAEHVRRSGQAHEPPPLTTRQRQILQLIATSRTTRQIAEHLKISVKTVEMHRVHLMRRLNVHDVAGLVRHALRAGVISVEDY